MYRTLAALFVVALLTPATALTQTISADRPGATDSAYSVPKGALQIETGFEARRAGSVQSVYHQLTLARIGLTEQLELRLTPPGTISINGAVAGTDPGLGLKVSGELGEETQLGVLASASIPAVNPGTGSVLQMRATLSTNAGPVSLGTTIGGSYGRVTTEDNQATFEGLATLTAGFGIVGDLGGYVEAYVTVPEDGQVSPVANAGLTYLVAPWLQLDAYGGAGIAGDAPDWLAGAGLAVLVPPSVLESGEQVEDDEAPEPTRAD